MVAGLVAVLGVAAEVRVVGVVELRLALVQQDVDGDGRADDQAAQRPGQVVGELERVAVLGGEELPAQAGVLLADPGDLDPRVVQDGEVPAVPVAPDLGDGVAAGVVEPEARAHEGAVLDDAAVGLVVRAAHVDVGAAPVPGLVQGQERVPLGGVDGEPVGELGVAPVRVRPGGHVLVHVRKRLTGLAEDLVVSFGGEQAAGLFDQQHGCGEQGCVHVGPFRRCRPAGRRGRWGSGQLGSGQAGSGGEGFRRIQLKTYRLASTPAPPYRFRTSVTSTGLAARLDGVLSNLERWTGRENEQKLQRLLDEASDLGNRARLLSPEIGARPVLPVDPGAIVLIGITLFVLSSKGSSESASAPKVQRSGSMSARWMSMLVTRRSGLPSSSAWSSPCCSRRR